MCDGLPLCVDCFSVGAYDVRPHQPAHAYRVVERVQESLYAKDWAAHEEERLLHALCDHGPNHWKDIADYVSSKSQMKCERHYQEVYLDGEMAPLPTEVVEKDVLPEPSSPTPVSEGKKTASGNRDEEREQRRVKPGVKAGIIEGYMPLRGDFDVEWDDDAENVIADLVIDPTDTLEELQLKLRLLEIYDHRLKRRDAVKEILSSHNLLDFGSHKVGGSRTARDEKELAARLKVFSRLLEKNVYNAVHDKLTNIYKLSRDVYRLAQARDAGVHHLSEVEVYDVERKTRAAKLTENSKIPDKTTERRRKPGAGIPPAAKRTKRRDGYPTPSFSTSLGNEGVFPNSSVPIEDNLHLVYSPTPEVAGLPPGVNAHDVLADDPMQNSPPNDAGIVVGTPLQSKTALLRKAREQRRMMKSTYPQVEAMDITSMPGATDLTESELVLCSSLRLPPEEFLTLRDAMLYVFNNNMMPATNVVSKSANDPIMTMRATKSRTQTASDNGRESTQLQVTYKPMMKSATAVSAKFKEEDDREIVKSGHYGRKCITSLIPASDQVISQDVPASSIVDVAHVELEKEESRIPTQVTLTKHEAHDVSLATRVRRNLQFDEEPMRYNVDGRDVHTSQSQITQINFFKNPTTTPRGKNTNAYPTSGRWRNLVGLTSGESLETHQDVGDITAECVGQSGVRLILSISLPDDEGQVSPSAQKRREVKVFVDIESENAKDESMKRPAALTETVGNLQNAMTSTAGAEESRSLYVDRIARSLDTLREEGGTFDGSVIENGNESKNEDVRVNVQLNRLGEARKESGRVRRCNGRRTVGIRSRGQARSVAKTRPITGGVRRTSRRKSTASPVVAAETATVVAEDGILENNESAGNLSLNSKRSKSEAIKDHPCGEWDNRPTECSIGQYGQGKIARLSNGIDEEELDKRRGNEDDFDRFASGVVQEEVLDEGNANSLGRRSVKNLLEVESNATMNVNRLLDGTEFVSNSVRNNDKEYLYIAPVGESIMHNQKSHQIVPLGESEKSDVDNEVATRRQDSTHHHYSEPDSPPESASAEDDADPSVDFSLAEDASEDDDDYVDERRLEETPRARRGRRAFADSTPKRISDRIRKRKRATTTPNSGLKPVKRRREAKASNVEVEDLGPDDAIHVPPPLKKPPPTTVRKSLRKTVGAIMEEGESVTKVPKNNRYSLRRRG